MVKDAEANKEADKKKESLLMQEIKLILLLHSTEKSLKEHGSKVSEAEKKAIETSAANLRNALKGTDLKKLKRKLKI